MPRHIPDGETNNRRRFVLTSAIIAISLLGDALLYALLPSRPNAFGIRIWQIGILLGANRFIRLLTNELAGRLTRRSRSNRPLYAAVILSSLITAAYALPLGFWGLLAARMAWGACWSLLRVEGHLAALSISTRRNRARVFAVFQTLIRIGQGGGVLIGGFLTDTIGIAPTFLLFGLATLSGVILLSRTPRRQRLPIPNPPNAGVGYSTVADAPGKAAAADPTHRSKSSLPLPVSGLIPLWGCALTLTLTDQMVANLTGRLVAERLASVLPPFLGVTSLTGLLLGFRSFGALVLGPLAGLAGDRYGRRSLLSIVVVLQACFIAGIALFPSWPLLVVCLLLQFAAGIVVYLLISTFAGDLAPDSDQALHMSRFSTFHDLGTSLGPVLGFAIYSRLGFLWVAVLAWLLIIAAFILLQRLSGIDREKLY